MNRTAIAIATAVLAACGVAAGEVTSATRAVKVQLAELEIMDAGEHSRGIATVQVNDMNTNQGVEGIAVRGEWSGSVTRPMTSRTGPRGTAMFKSPIIEPGSPITFSITDISGEGVTWPRSADERTSYSLPLPHGQMPFPGMEMML